MKSFQAVAKPAGPICNLDCKYCFYLEKEKLYPEQSNFIMNENILESFIQQKIEGQESEIISFLWQGGEPTLTGIDFYRKATALQKKYANGKKIENALQTNGILLNDEWCRFFKENNFLIGISIDGPAELHDLYRVNKGNQPTFKKVISGIELLKKHEVEFNTLTVVHNENSKYPLKVYNFLKEAGSGYMQFIPLVERAAVSQNNIQKLVSPEYAEEAFVTDWSVEPLTYGRFLCKIFDEWVTKDVGKCFVQIFDVSLESWLGLKQSLCIFNPTCGNVPAIEHNGDLYSCDHFVYPENKLGNILGQPLASLLSSNQQINFGKSKKDSLPEYCRKCEVRFACNGECPKHRFLTTPDGEYGLNYLCAGYKLFFNHIDPYMKFMANELVHRRPPANIMNWKLNTALK